MTENATPWVAVHREQLATVEGFLNRVLAAAGPVLATNLTNDLEMALAHLTRIADHNPRTAAPEGN